ncbi:MAG: hypothetical protein JNL32_11460 [Candidatus Kapabacteria bacterium]|nr:hypothetical protein [Candidatus Kapabacteria bacterium]
MRAGRVLGDIESIILPLQRISDFCTRAVITPIPVFVHLITQRMPVLAIESNGRIEKTALYFNGEQIAGVKELFLNIDEDGTFDAVLQYQNESGDIVNKQVFTEYLDGLKTMPPAFTDEEAQQMQLLSVDSSGAIDDTFISINDQPLDGIVSMFVHIKAPVKNNSSGLSSLFGKKAETTERGEFKAEVTFRNEDDSQSTEAIF